LKASPFFRIASSSPFILNHQSFMIQQITSKIKNEGLISLIQSIIQKIYRSPLSLYKSNTFLFEKKEGLEVGGPSTIFAKNNLCPIYSIVRSIDNCNFKNYTIWEGEIKSGKTFNYSQNGKSGNQYIAEAYNLSFAAAESYDFLASSHMIEHSANPLKVLQEWRRVIKLEGVLLIAIPHKNGTFDRYRQTTSIDHLIQDFEQGTNESDFTHLDEILRLHDFTRDLPSGGIEKFTKRCEDNFNNRCIHHHVFTTKLAIKMIDQAGFQIIDVSTAKPFHIVILSKKINSWDNNDFLNGRAIGDKKSIFPFDME
jgi:SAM-dependent methyltransferase